MDYGDYDIILLLLLLLFFNIDCVYNIELSLFINNYSSDIYVYEISCLFDCSLYILQLLLLLLLYILLLLCYFSYIL